MICSDTSRVIDLYRAITTARHIDIVEKRYVSSGQAFFHVSGMGHCGSAALAPCLGEQDWLFCHYRAKALMVARGAKPEDFFRGFLSKARSHSGGRLMSVHFSDVHLRLFSLLGLVGNSALHAVGVASTLERNPGSPIVVCGIGDGGTQQGEFLEAIAEAVRSQLPVLFLVEDNGYAISTRTRGRTFFSLPSREADEYLGVPITRGDGRQLPACLDLFEAITGEMRRSRRPAIVVLESDRLDNHSNADDQSRYRDAEEIRQALANSDPVHLFEKHLVAMGVLPELLAEVQASAKTAVEDAARRVMGETDTSVAIPSWQEDIARGGHDDVAADGFGCESVSATMHEAIRNCLREHLAADERVELLGQDIEDPKGDVFGLTRGMSTSHPCRVANAPLSESTIVGVCIGKAIAGRRPVAMIQFADFLPLAFNQISQELAMFHWRTNGSIRCPVIIMAPCGAYRAGLGPYHAQTMDSILSHVPGLVVVVPSNAEDAADLLRAAFRSLHPVVFLYPKSLLNVPQAGAPAGTRSASFGKARLVRQGRDLTIVTWGSTMPICERAADVLAEDGITVDLVDLRTLAPWDKDAVAVSSNKTGRLLIVHEDNLTGGFGAEVAATAAEQANRSLAVRRVARPDTFVPYNLQQQQALLPSIESVVSAAGHLLGKHIDNARSESFELPPNNDKDLLVMRAFRASPSDTVFRVISITVRPGEHVAEGAVLGEYETEKCSVEFCSPATGTISAIHASPGDELRIGEPLISIRTAAEEGDLSRCNRSVVTPAPLGTNAPRAACVGRKSRVGLPIFCSDIHVARGGQVTPNARLLAWHADKTSEDILRVSGIASRQWLGPQEDRTGLAAHASAGLLKSGAIETDRVGMMLVSTTTLDDVSPSTACMLLRKLETDHGLILEKACAMDISAACSGFLYGLATAFDYVREFPDQAVLLVTAETLSPLLDMQDFSTSILFGDAATATLVGTHSSLLKPAFGIARPILGSKPDKTGSLVVPAMGTGRFLRMDGQRVFREAVRAMSNVAKRACKSAGITVDELRMIVPHQANQRIMEAVASTIGIDESRLASNIRTNGNTSSSSIPLALSDLLEKGTFRPGDKICLCTFGAGFTYGAALVEIVDPELLAQERQSLRQWPC